MLQPAQIGVEEGAQVGDAVFQHGDAVDAHAPGKALPFVGVEAAMLQHARMHHAGAENLEPVITLADAPHAPLAREIGRASCRESGCQYGSNSVVAVSLKKNRQKQTITKTD